MSDHYEPTPEEEETIRQMRQEEEPAQIQEVHGKSHRPNRALVETHRMLPADPDAEKGVLSSMLLAPLEVVAMVRDLGITPDAFSIPSFSEIYRTLVAMDDEGRPIDAITLTDRLRAGGKLDQVGGRVAITELFGFLPTAANAGRYTEIVEDKRQLRDAIRICTTIASRCYEPVADTEEVIEALEKGALSVRNARFGKRNEKTIKAFVMEAATSIQDLYERRGAVSGITTGFADLDKVTNGLTPDRFIIIAARPSMGKTALAMNIAEHVGCTLAIPVAVFSLEMSGQQLMQRMLCSRAKVNTQRMRDGFMNERDFPALTAAATHLSESQIIIDDFTEATIEYVKARLRRIRQKFPDGLVAIIDYLQLLSSSNKRAFNREQEVAAISRGCKLIAKELNIPLIGLAQIGRGPETNNRKPRLSDLRESGSLEQDADDVWFIHRPEMACDDEEEKQRLSGKAFLTVAKQRNGEVGGEIPLTFLKEFTRFETRAYTDEPEEAPAKKKPYKKLAEGKRRSADEEATPFL